MRISVCEFLRLATSKDWFYSNPGHWVSDGYEFEVKRVDGPGSHEFRMYKGKRHIKTLYYYEGLSSIEVRRLNRGK